MYAGGGREGVEGVAGTHRCVGWARGMRGGHEVLSLFFNSFSLSCQGMRWGDAGARGGRGLPAVERATPGGVHILLGGFGQTMGGMTRRRVA